MRVKKFLAGMLSVSMLSMMCAGTLTASANLIGDVDGSGHVNPGDSIEILNANTGMKELACDEAVADVNLDGVINECDAAAIAAYYMADIDTLPAEAPLTDEPVDPFPHTFSFSMSDVTGYTGTTVPVQIYLDQSKDYAWLFQLDAMRLSVAADDAVRISSVQMNANFWIGNPDRGVISGAYVKHEDSTRPVATVYVELPADMAPGVYTMDFVAEECFIGDMFGQIADEVSFTGGTIVVEAAPETIATTTTTTTEMTTTTTTGVTETDYDQTEYPEETSPVPDTTEILDTTAPVFTEETVTTVQTVAPADGLEMKLSQFHVSHEVGTPIWLEGITASVFSEKDGYLLSAEPITNTDYFVVDDSRYNPYEEGYYYIYVYYMDEAGVRLIESFTVDVYAATTTTDDTIYTGETTTTSMWTTTIMTHITTTVTTATTWNTTLPTTETTIITTAGPDEETTVAYTTNMYTDEDGVVCFEYCANIGDTILVDEIYAGLPYVIIEECASYENGIITAISAGEFYMDFFASDALTEKVAHVRVHVFAEPDEDPETEPTWTETTIVTTWHTGLHTTGMTTTTIASTLDENGNVIYGTTMPTDTVPSGSDSEEEPIATTTSETNDDGNGTDWVGSEEVNGTTAVGTMDVTTETTTAITEIAPEEPTETDTSTEIAPETTVSDADTEDATEPAETLPQTGNPAWFGWMLAGAVLLMTAGGWMMMQSGILKKDEE